MSYNGTIFVHIPQKPVKYFRSLIGVTKTCARASSHAHTHTQDYDVKINGSSCKG